MVVSNYRVAPIANLPSTVIQTPPGSSSSPNVNSNRVGRSHRQCLILVAIASTLVVAVLIAATVLIWLALGHVLFNGSSAKNSTVAAQSPGLNLSTAEALRTIPNLFSLGSANSTFSPLIGQTMTDLINGRLGTTTMTTRLSADSKLNFPPCPNQNQIQCRSDGKCIIANKRCNKVKDCADASDEFNCSCVDILRSTSSRKLCDGYADCPSDEDEKDCAYQCQNASDSRQWFRCVGSSNCISISQVCDGKIDCTNGQDESECWMLAPNLDATTATNYRSYYDFGYVFRRRNGVWYPVSTNSNIGALGQFVCEQVQYRSVLYVDQRILTDSRASGCFVTTGSSNAPPTSDSAFQLLRSSCPNRKAVYVACDEFACGHLSYCRPARKRIVGGTDTGAYCNPWTVALYRDGEMVCHAVVLNNLWLMTAAHCFRTTELRRRWIARLGMYRQQSWSPNTITRNIVAAIRHPNFTDIIVETNDIALLRMDRPVTFSASLQPPCMPHNDDYPKDGDTCTVYGWGYLKEDDLQFSDELRQVDLSVISNDRCNASPEFFRTYITDGHLCLGHGSEKKDACQGDSGGPLVCSRASDRSRYLAGLTSTGDGCARANVPGIWTRLSQYMDWILHTMASSMSDLASMSMQVGADKPCTGFQCQTGKCVYSYYRCDGGWDCEMDGSDELFCSHDLANDDQSTLAPGVTTSSGSTTTSRCEDGDNDGFLCSDGVTCLPYYQRCDYILDCPGGEDEKNCFYCLDTDIPCDDSRRCLPFSVSLLATSNDTFGRWVRDRFDCSGAK